MSVKTGWLLLGLSLLVSLWISGGLTGVGYALIFGVAVLPGIPLGVVLFGPRHPAAWVSGALVGYGVTQLMLWAMIEARLASPLWFTLGWLALLGVTSAIAWLQPKGPAIAAPSWTTADFRTLLIVVALIPLLMGLVYRNLGRADAEGNRYYRAYFTADFLWHGALANELGKFSLPPRNPYLAPRAMNYYWTYFLLPASVAEISPGSSTGLSDEQRCLKSNAILIGLLMFAALFVFVRSAVATPGAAAAAVLLALLAASAEGLYAIIDLLREGRPLTELLDTNVDAITAWEFGGLRVDNMPRSLWYTPQHTTSIALGLTALTCALLGGAAAPLRAVLGAGLALGLSTTMNPLLGGVCSLLYGVVILVDAIRRPGAIVMIVRHALAGLFVVAAVGWAAASRVMDGAGSALDIGFSGFSRQSPVVTLLLSIGPILVPALPGIFGARTDVSRRGVTVAAAGILIGLFLLYFVRVSEASWVGFRAGQILLVSIPVLLALTLERLPRLVRAVTVALILVIGLPTSVVDLWNAQDIWNRRPGPGFRWTLWTTPDQQEAFDWIRANTPTDAIVQMEPMVRGREHWTLIPTFAARRMTAGLPISLLPIPEYAERSEIVRQLFQTPSPQHAADLAHRLRIDFLYVDQEDVAAYPEGTAKFDTHPELFAPVFRNRSVRIYRLR